MDNSYCIAYSVYDEWLTEYGSIYNINVERTFYNVRLGKLELENFGKSAEFIQIKVWIEWNHAINIAFD